ncbi:MAG: 2-C-methyl-D-erythritol 2,4-cyclodiphosphate synthase [Candidatus Neomarinimicrobiota bacterium]
MKKHDPKLTIIIPAAGAGKRMKSDVPKILLKLKGQTILERTIRAFFTYKPQEIIIPVSAGIKDELVKIIESLNASFPIKIVDGGKERQDSIWNAVNALSQDCEIVAIHDAARPFFKSDIFDEAYELLQDCAGAVAAVPATYTMKIARDRSVINTPDRKELWQVNTPQIFNRDILVKAYKQAYADNFYGTDDAMLLERIGETLKIIEDIPENIKITHPGDMVLAEQILSGEKGASMQRVGQGYDVHKLVEGRKLILGGVEIPHEKGLDGHSDADVLIHVIMDAILGAAALGDLGKHFPDTDKAYKNIDSMFLLYGVRKLLEVNQYTIQNIDATLILQAPKVAPYIETMRKNIAEKLDLDISQVSVKATTEEGLGFTGRKEGIAATAIVMLNC